MLTHKEAATARAELAELDKALRELTLPKGAIQVSFSLAEMKVLLVAIDNGAEGVLQPRSAQSSAEKQAFVRAANRLIEATGLPYSRY